MRQRLTATVVASGLAALACSGTSPSTPGAARGGSDAAGGTGAALAGASGASGGGATNGGNGPGGGGATASGGTGGALAGLGGASPSGGAGGGTSEPVGTPYVYVGSYANAIHVFELDRDTGALTARGAPVSAPPSPSFLAVAPDARHLFAVNEADNVDGTGSGAVSAFSVDAGTGALTFLNRVSSQGAGPAHVSTDRSGRFVFVANYNGGSVAVFPVSDDGRLGAAVDTEAHGGGAQSHAVVVDPSNRYLFVPNKGLSNVAQYRFDATTGALTPGSPAALALPSGAGSRHLAFHPSLPYAYLINELDDTLSALAFDAAAGTLSVLQTLSTLPDGVDGGDNSGAEVQVAPSGSFVYGSNRGHDSIVIYSVDAATGRLTLVGHQPTGGSTPRSFHIEASGEYMLVANQSSNEVVTFRVDRATGGLSELGAVDVPSPAFVGAAYVAE